MTQQAEGLGRARARARVDQAAALGTTPVAPRTLRPSWERQYAGLMPLGDLAITLLVAVGCGRLPWVEQSAALLLAFVWLVPLAVGGAYESRVLGQGSDEYKRVLSASWQYAALLGLVAYAVGENSVRGCLFVVLPVGTTGLLLGRQTVRRFVWSRRRQGFALHRLVVIGPAFTAADLIREVQGRDDTGFSVVGVCTAGVVEDGMTDDVPEQWEFHDVLETIGRTRADTVAVVGTGDMPQGFVRRLAWQLEGTGVDLMVSPAITDIAGPRIHVRPVANMSMLYVEAPRFTGASRVLKNASDRIAALLLIVALTPLFALVALAVALDSRGGVFFRQERLGLGGEAFSIWKFRTMHVEAERLRVELEALNESDGGLFKLRRDPRVTPVGAFLRRWSIDELPQLLNVLRGQMSMIGPRPLPLVLEDVAGDEHRRLLVRPGMTGLWQVSGRSDLSWDESVRLDLYYVENWSLAVDAVILLRTVLAVLRRHGAY
ncbi:MAG: Undecaprenyl-phosphate galactose phosphotransferase [Frankiales bacterium]|nr:Undecaprenyl-phosphate galactose phosphotransferase [Frankiales bacterium]